MQPIVTAYNHFIRTTYIMLPAQLFGLLMLNHLFLLILPEQSNSGNHGNKV